MADLLDAAGCPDAKQEASHVVGRFDTLAKALAADALSLRRRCGEGARTSAKLLPIVRAIMLSVLREELRASPVLANQIAAVSYLRARLAFLGHEEVHILFLDGARRVIGEELHTVGSLDRSEIDPRRIVLRCLETGAAGFIVAHNHPSGEPSPTRADIEATRHLQRAAQLFDIQLTDHLILGRSGYASLLALGHLEVWPYPERATGTG